jgi:hypothetical protein
MNLKAYIDRANGHRLLEVVAYLRDTESPRIGGRAGTEEALALAEGLEIEARYRFARSADPDLSWDQFISTTP